MTIQELINQQMDHFVAKLAAKGELSIEKITEVTTHIAAYLIRNRHIQNGNISDNEIHMVLQSIANYLEQNFENQFEETDFINIKNETLNLLKEPTFDQDIQDYFKQFYQ